MIRPINPLRKKQSIVVLCSKAMEGSIRGLRETASV